MNRTLVILLTLAVVSSAAIAQSTITLRRSLRIEPGQPVTLADVCVLDGYDALALRHLELIEPGELKTGDRRDLTVSDVRLAIDEHDSVHWGRLTLTGGRCVVLVPDDRPLPQAQAAESVPDSPGPQPVSGEGDDVRAHVVRVIASTLSVRDTDLRLGFDPRDEGVLETSTVGRFVHAQPTGSSDKLPVRVMVYEGDRIIIDETVRVEVLVRRRVALVSAPIRRGDEIEQQQVKTGEQWLRPSEPVAPMQDVVGSAARSRLDPGDVVLKSHVEPPVVVERGDIVTVQCISGGVLLQLAARAMKSARDGEIIPFERIDGTPGQFMARMNGRGRAVTVAISTEGEAP